MVVLRWCVLASATIVLASSLGATAPPRAGPQLLPVDEAAKRPEFFSFRARLQTAVARHDVDALMAVVDPKIKCSFDGDDGIDAFRQMWKIGEAGSEIWAELSAVLALGGTFQDDRTFVAPYTFSRWPEQYDAFEHVALTAADVRIREAPRADAAVIATHSFAILRVPMEQPREAPGWTAVRLDHKVGYVAAQFARSPIAYRAYFSSREGRWQLAMFVAGD